ncbi:universal stress protein [Brevundimonas sp.]|uniref:universal stress protein n=1 Tax=Brevundimonas sp. TaxID=1871086 RepID=UPI002D37416F|nr:universal stress protein [Brevundimonas sp.]HYD27705.1 universal stress protein [Brevundimonas sp.]
MTYSSIMTLVDGSPAAIQRARIGAALAERFDACLTGVFPRPPLPVSAWDEPVYWGMPPVIPPAIPPEVIAAHERRTDEQGEEARLAFEAAAALAGCRSNWLVLPSDDGAGVLELARRSDLAVLPSGRLPTVGPTGSAAADLALATGGPALILPESARDPVPGRRIVVAWNGSREAARAVRDAWPFLQGAEAVFVVIVSPAGTDGPESQLQRYFEEHGCTAQVVVVREADASAADVLRTQVETLRADLVVMGLFGHSRLRETVLGGVSRSLVGDPPVPMLVSH